MKSTSLSIANKINPLVRAVYENVHVVAASVGADWLVVGATARDMVYHAAQTRHKHRLELADSSLWVDIIPFGAIADENGKYCWQGEPEVEISVAGFQEALETAIICRAAEDPILDLKVVHPAVLIMIKIISWRDRRLVKKTDAQDVAYAMSYYTQLDGNEMRVYDDPTLFEGDLDMGTVGARLAGRDLASLAPGKTLKSLHAFVQEQIDLDNESEFLAYMMRGSVSGLNDSSQYSGLMRNLVIGIDEVFC